MEPHGLSEYLKRIEADPRKCVYCGKFTRKNDLRVIYEPDSDKSTECIDTVCKKCYERYKD